MPNTLDTMVLVTPDGRFSEKFSHHVMYLVRQYHWNMIVLSIGRDLATITERDLPGYCATYSESCEKNLAPLAQAAREAGVDFAHMVRFGGTEETVDTICSERNNIRCVLFDSKRAPEVRLP